VLLVNLVTILLLAQLFAHLVFPDALPAVLPLVATNVSQTSTEVALVLPVMLAHSPLLDQAPQLIVKPVMILTVKLAQVMQLENVLCARMVMLCLAESALNVVIPTVTNALLLELDNVILALPVTP